MIDGALDRNGMIGWSEFINPDDAEAIRAFVSAEAVKLRDQPRAAAPAGPRPRAEQ